MRKAIILFTAALAAAVVVSAIAVSGAGAKINGEHITGMYGTGCAPCHGSKPGPQGSIYVTGPSAGIVMQGQTVEFRVIAAALPLGVAGGIDAAVVDSAGNKVGTMTAGTNTKVVDGQEIVHDVNAAGLTVNGRVWIFKWTAPSAPYENHGLHLKIAVNAANGDGAANFDSQPAGVGDAWYLKDMVLMVHSEHGM